MASLALLVSIILLCVLVCGPLSLLLAYIGFSILATSFGVISIIIGIYWCCFAPFPVSLIGGLTAICGAIAINKSW